MDRESIKIINFHYCFSAFGGLPIFKQPKYRINGNVIRKIQGKEKIREGIELTHSVNRMRDITYLLKRIHLFVYLPLKLKIFLSKIQTIV